MKNETEKDIDTAVKAYVAGLIAVLSASAMKAFIVGDLQAHEMLKLKPVNSVIQSDAALYMKEYRKLLVDEGATIIKGKKVKWMVDHEKEVRKEFTNVIEKGLKEGKHPDIKKPVRKGTIAYDIKQVVKGLQESKYPMWARSETANVINVGTLKRFENKDIEEVMVFDNEGPNSCEACMEANGQTWSIQKASANPLEHPNCVRAFGPIVKK